MEGVFGGLTCHDLGFERQSESSVFGVFSRQGLRADWGDSILKGPRWKGEASQGHSIPTFPNSDRQ